MDMTFPSAVYALCFLTAILCAILLGRMYVRTGLRLVMLSSLCFALLAVANLLVIADIVASVDLRPARLVVSLVAVSVLLFGFIWDQDH